MDAVILASPNHTMNVNWLMKNFIDRLSYLMHRPRFFDQRFFILITSGSFPGIKKALKALSPMASGGKIVNRLGVMNSPGMNHSKIKKEEKKISAHARNFTAAMQKKHKFGVSFINMLWFSVFKATTKIQADKYPADFEYYKNKNFFVETQLRTYQRLTISVFTKFFQFLVKKGFV